MAYLSMLTPMIQPNTAGHPVPAPAIPPERLMEYFSQLVQNGSLPLPPVTQPSSLPTVSVPPSIPLPTQGRSFTRPNRGMGGELAEKQKVSKQITASANKRKTLVDSDIETQSAGAESTNVRQAKRSKTAKVSSFP